MNTFTAKPNFQNQALQEQIMVQQNMMAINDQLNYINTFNQGAVYNNQQLLELQEA